MALNWTTFLLEIINFLVLVWLLKRFLYRPVKDVIARRQQTIEERLQQADARLTQAEALHGQYENRLADWQSERQHARLELQSELEQERQRGLQALQQEIAAEREKAAVQAERQLHEQQRQNEIQSLEQGARFAGKLLRAAASPELQDRMYEYLLTEMQQLPQAYSDALRAVGSVGSVQVSSAFPLAAAQRERLQKQLAALIPDNPEFAYREDRALIAGFRLTVGSWVLRANLQDELQAFAAFAHER